MKLRPYLLALATLLVLAGIPLGASALPGQTLAAFAVWSAHQPLLRGLKRSTDEMSGWPSFSLLTADHGIAWRMDAHTDNRSIVSEGLGVSTAGGAPGTEPIRHDGAGYGFVFFRSLYGPAIANDYRDAPSVASFKDPSNGSVTTFYRGKRYGYSSANGFLTLETQLAFDRDLALMRRCTAKPQTCIE